MLGHELTAALPELRAQAESTMTDVCTIARESVEWSEAEQESVAVWTAVHTAVPCKVLSDPASSGQIITGAREVWQGPQVRLSASLGGVMPDDRVTVVSSTDADLVGAVLWVTDSRGRTNAVQRRLLCRWSR